MVFYQCARCKQISSRLEAFRKVKVRGKARLSCPVCWNKQRQTAERDGLIVLVVSALLWLLLVALVGDAGILWLLVSVSLTPLLMILLVIPHELAHALTAWLLGQRVFTLSVGSGKVLGKWRLRGTQLVLRAIPTWGITHFASPSLRLLRTRRFLTVLAGPALHIALIVAIFLTLSFSALPPPDSTRWDPALAPLPSWLPAWLILIANFVLANGLIVCLNLWPRAYQRDGRLALSDGLALLRTPFLSAAAVRELHAEYFLMEGESCRQEGRYTEAAQWYRSGLALYPNSQLLYVSLGWALLLEGKVVEARQHWLARRPQLESIPLRRLLFLDAIATADLLLASPAFPLCQLPPRSELIEEADAFSQEVFQEMPWEAVFKGTRGGVLVVRGEMEEGERLLHEAIKEDSDPRNQAFSACYLALAAAKRGQDYECQRFLEMARTFDSQNVALPLVQEEAATLLA